MAAADQTHLPNNALAAVEPAEVLTRQEAINLMAGRTRVASYLEREHELGATVLEVDNLNS